MLSTTDVRKRIELVHEFIYYVFDSMLIPLIQTNFYVTESSSDRNRLFYFRHDVWRRISEPSLTTMKLSLLEELPIQKARKMLHSSGLGWSRIRLLPKKNRVRPIMNLRRKQLALTTGKKSLGPSINTLLSPVFSILNYEKKNHLDMLQSAIFSVNEIHDRLKSFRQKSASVQAAGKLYFVKLDVQSCFDTIPQAEILGAIHALISEDQYQVSRYAELKPIDVSLGKTGSRSRKFVSLAAPPRDVKQNYTTAIYESAESKKNIVYTKTAEDQVWQTKRLLRMLDSHVTENLIKVGKKHYRQKTGIPQGSIISTLLCSLFYGRFEIQALGFLKETESLLLRLVDDFLLITLNKHHAERFLEVMTVGDASYGITVNLQKSLTNFPVSVDGLKAPSLNQTTLFPYCSMLINTENLEITKDRARSCQDMGNTLTVEHNNAPGRSFTRKMMACLKIQMHAMLLDTSFIRREVVMSTFYQVFLEVGMKLHRYVRILPKSKRPSSRSIVATVNEVLQLAFSLSQSKRSKAVANYDCTITAGQVFWIGASAFQTVLMKKQSRYANVIIWLQEVMRRNRLSLNMKREDIDTLVQRSVASISHCRF